MVLSFCYVFQHFIVDVTEERRAAETKHYKDVVLQCVPKDDAEAPALEVPVEGVIELLKVHYTIFREMFSHKSVQNLFGKCIV